jgi:hypothetical protein
MAGDREGTSSSEGHENPGLESLVRKNKDEMQANRGAEEEEANTKPNVKPASGQTETRRQPVEAQTSEKGCSTWALC